MLPVALNEMADASCASLVSARCAASAVCAVVSTGPVCPVVRMM
jgi:hypothetical protein